MKCPRQVGRSTGTALSEHALAPREAVELFELVPGLIDAEVAAQLNACAVLSDRCVPLGGGRVASFLPSRVAAAP